MNNYDLCIYLSKCYHAGSDLASDLEKVDLDDISPFHFEGSEISWFKVGHNASHYFYLGTDNEGKLHKCSYAGDWEFTIPYEEWKALLDSGKREEARQYEKFVEDIHITPVVSIGNIGYIGHW